MVRSLRAATDAPIVAAGPTAGELAALTHVDGCIEAGSLPAALRAVTAEHLGHVLLVGEPVIAPIGLLDRALDFVDGDGRVATVSFFANAAEFLSFPFRNHPLPLSVSGHDATSLTATLRVDRPEPAGRPDRPGHRRGRAPVGQPAWHIAGDARTTRRLGVRLRRCPGVRGRAARGFFNLLDAGTYVLHADDLSRGDEVGWPTGADKVWLDERDPHTAALVAEEAASDESPLGLAFTTARAKIQGLRIFMDGSSLGPLETGTQVGLVQLAERLAARDDVANVTIGLFGEVPAYAVHLLRVPKVELRHTPPGNDLASLGRFDVAFRPNQPDVLYDIERHRTVASRVIVSILDLIAYGIGSYQRTPEEWLSYRSVLRDRVGRVDGVITISADVKAVMALEQLPIERERVFTVPYGTQHLVGGEELRAPASITWRDRVARPFLLCLGTNYSHKNRDVAVRTHAELVRRGRVLDLVLVGASVPFGTSRVVEDDALTELEAAGDAAVLTIPDVPSPERNWLFRHAEVLLYPTSAEGFGLVPYEAAAFDTPSVYVPFGPLEEIGGDLPVTAADWRPASFADAVERLLDDPALAEAQVAALAAKGSTYSWDATAEGLVRAFRQLLSMPARDNFTATEAR